MTMAMMLNMLMLMVGKRRKSSSEKIFGPLLETVMPDVDNGAYASYSVAITSGFDHICLERKAQAARKHSCRRVAQIVLVELVKLLDPKTLNPPNPLPGYSVLYGL